ncbi:17514_t:CDS:2 [Racocetra fulgida]|uniref:17514_t:CDS:1 n=1 Tax=Racocetra fulgida TaxID=60492 RepID=A0A9N9D9G8_9GLOM|nr:17514_t:CDS:2 [Racocetra fulgida]
MLTKEIITYTICYLSKSIVVNDRSIKQVNISSHCDKHDKEGITKEKIMNLVELLDKEEFEVVGEDGKKEEKLFRQVESDNVLGSVILSKEATTLEKIKYELCQNIVRYKRIKKMTLDKVANILRLDELTTNKLLHYHIEAFALDSLISYVEKLNLPLRVKITSEEKRQNEKDIEKFTERFRKELLETKTELLLTQNKLRKLQEKN